MSNLPILLRALGFLVGALFLLVGLLLALTEDVDQGFSLLLLGSMFLAYGVSGNSGYRRYLWVLALPASIVGLLWFGHGLWTAATEWETSDISGEGMIALRTQPVLFSVLVWGKLVMFAICSVCLVFVMRFGWPKRKVL